MRVGESHLHSVNCAFPRAAPCGQSGHEELYLSLKKRYYIMFVSSESDGTLTKVPIPLHYAYIVAAAAVVGIFTVTGLAGSYSRMLIKTAHFNQLRQDHNNLQRDYAHLEHSAHERDIQVASLGTLATEVSALYGMTASKLAGPAGHLNELARHGRKTDIASVSKAPLATETNTTSDADVYKSLDTFYALRSNAFNGSATRFLATPAQNGFGTSLNRVPGVDTVFDASAAPSLWPVMGSITSGFGQRVDPVLGTGEGEFHKGIDIAAPMGTPIRATANGVVISAGLSNGYGREVILDHGHGIKTLYGHMSGFNVLAGQTVFAGQIIGYVGHSGRVSGATGNHVHYEVRIHDLAVNPHKYLRITVAGLGANADKGL